MAATCRKGEGEAPWRRGAQTALTAGHGGCQPWQGRREAKEKSSCQFERKERRWRKACSPLLQRQKKTCKTQVYQPEGLTKWPLQDAPWWIIIRHIQSYIWELKVFQVSSLKDCLHEWISEFSAEMKAGSKNCNLTCRCHRSCPRSFGLLCDPTRYKPNKQSLLYAFFFLKDKYWNLNC